MIDDTDIEASAEASMRGESPSAQLRATAPDWQLVAADVCMGCSADRIRGNCSNPKCTWDRDTVTLHGEQLAAHLALQDAAKALKNAQAAQAAAQAVFRGCLERWCKASEQS